MIKQFNQSLAQISSPRPAIARVLLEVGVNGELAAISSTLGETETVELLDKAMEAIDGQRVPPEVG